MLKREEWITVPRWPEIMIGHFVDWLYEKSYADGTIQNYQRNLFRYAKFFRMLNINDFLLIDLSSRSLFVKTVMTFHRELLTRNKYRKKKLNIVVILQQYIAAWHAFGRWLSTYYEVPFLPMQLPKIAQLLPKTIDLSLIKLKVDYSSRSWLYWRNLCMLELAAYSGLRNTEIGHLKLSDIDWDDSSIRIHGKSPRVVFVDRLTLSHLMYCCFYRPKLETPFLFCSMYMSEEPISQQHISKIIRTQAHEMCGIHVNTRILRHSVAAHFYIKTHDVLVVAALMGFKSVKTSMSYAALDLPHFRAELAKYHPRWQRQNQSKTTTVADAAETTSTH